MDVELINTGTELLLGQVVNTHLKLIAEAIFPLGLRVSRQVTVPDGPAIHEALAESCTRARVVIVTGGLGPTTDDVTRDAVAALFGLELVHDEAVMEAIAARFARRSIKLTERVRLQALRPREARVLPNAHGTAPGLYLAPALTGRAEVFLLPGPPRELRPMLYESVLPVLTALCPAGSRPQMRTYRLAGLGESNVEAAVGAELLALGLELGYCARPGAVDVRTIGSPEALDRAQAILEAALGEFIFASDDRSLEQVVIEQLAARRETLATAESCTGGSIAHRLTNVPGASAVFLAGYVTYADSAKTHSLGVPPELIATHGAVSEPVARSMALGARAAAGASYAASTTGIAGPAGGTEGKPVGTVFIGLATPDGEVTVEKHRFATDRENFKNLTTQAALGMLRKALSLSASPGV